MYQRWTARMPHEADAEIHRRLLEAMIEKLRPDGDMAALVYAAQSLVERGFGTLGSGPAQEATKLFAAVAMELFEEIKTAGTYHRDLLPLLHAEDADISNMLADVALVAKKQIVREYAIQVCPGALRRRFDRMARVGALLSGKRNPRQPKQLIWRGIRAAEGEAEGKHRFVRSFNSSNFRPPLIHFFPLRKLFLMRVGGSVSQPPAGGGPAPTESAYATP